MNLQQMESEDLDILIAKMLSEMKQTQIEEDKKEYYEVNADGSVDMTTFLKIPFHPNIDIKIIS